MDLAARWTKSNTIRKGVEMNLTTTKAVAGQFSVTAQTDDGPLTFVGSVYGGPVVMITPGGTQTFVTDPGRFGKFGKEWVEAFLA